MPDETVPATSFQGDAEAILAISENADQGILDLVDAYKSTSWDNPEIALQTVQDYATKLRQKNPGEENLLTSQETVGIAPVSLDEVGGYIEEWEKRNLAEVKKGTNPLLRAYNDSVTKAIEDVTTGVVQEENVLNDVSQFQDKTTRAAMGAIPGVIKALGVEKDFERGLRADSNDTLASVGTSVVGSLLALPVFVASIPVNAYTFGKEQYEQSKASGATGARALGSAALEGANQALDVVLDKLFLGTKERQGARFLTTLAKKSLAEGSQEFAQDKLTDVAKVAGLNKDEFDAFVNAQSATSFAAGAIGGGVAHTGETVAPGLFSANPFGLSPEIPVGSSEGVASSAPVQEAATILPSLEEEIGLQSLFPETEPRRAVSVIGEPVANGTNVTTLEDASSGRISLDSAPALSTDAGEMLLVNPDGSTSRVINGEEKQAHQNATIVSDETAKKLSELQVAEIGGEPVVIKTDDLGRPYIDNPYVQNDLSVSDTPSNPSPVLIPEDTTGHVLQHSDRVTELDSVEHRATLSQGKSGGVSTAGAQEVRESSIADKLRQSESLNPHVKELLGLNEDFSQLVYPANSNDQTRRDVDAVFAKFDNNYVAFANDLTNKDYSEITPDDAIAAALASTALSSKADSIRAENPIAAEKYDILSGKLAIASQKVRSEGGQTLQKFSVIPVNGNSIVAAVKSDALELAGARAAQELNLSPKEVEHVTQENIQLDKISDGINEREVLIQEEEVAAEERHNAPDAAVETLEKDILAIDSSPSPEIVKAEEAVQEVEKTSKEVEKRAADLEKEADDIETAQEDARDDIKDLTQKVEELSNKPVEVPETTQVDNLKAKKEELKQKENPQVKSLEEKVRAAKEPNEKARARLELTKAINEERAKGAKELSEINNQIRAAEEAHEAEQRRLKEVRAAEIKAAKEELAQARRDAAASKKEVALKKRKEANELRAERKKLLAEKEQGLREAKRQRAEETAELKKQKKEALSRAKEERAATREIRKKQLEVEKERLKAQKELLKGDREKIAARKARNKHVLDTVSKYKKEFTDKLSPAVTDQINELVKIVQTTSGSPKKAALSKLGKIVADIKGVKLQPGSDPWSVFWQSNVLFSLGTNAANILGNVVRPVVTAVSDIASLKPAEAGRFLRGWGSAIFGKRTLQDIQAGLAGELDSRRTDEIIEEDLKDLASGVHSIHENDPVRTLENLFGTGKLGKFLTHTALSLRALGAMDAVFSRAAREGYLARGSESYETYLADKAASFNQYVAQARNEELQLKKLGADLPKNYVEIRADELSFQSKPEAVRTDVARRSRRDVFQEEGGPRGLTGKAVGGILNAVGNFRVPGLNRYNNLNARLSVASALGFEARVAKDGVGVDKVYPLVAEGVAQGKTLVINGSEVKAGSTAEVLTQIVDALAAKQVISLKGESIRPMKYMVGMFVNTAAQLMDASVELIPFAGYADKRFGGNWKEYTPDEKRQLRGAQIFSTALTAGLLWKLLPEMDDEEHASVYVYGGMRDKFLRESYKAKGIRPFSIRIGNKTISYKDTPGLNLILGGIGELADAHMVAKRADKAPLTVGAAMKTVAMGSLYSASQLSLLKNVSVIADLLALEDEAAVLDVVSNVTSGYIPYAGAGRELERFVYGDLTRSKDTMSRMLQNVPFAKFVSDNKPALNMFGEPLRSSILPGVGRFLGDSQASFELDWALSNGYKFSLPKASNALTKKQLESYSEMQRSDDPDNFEPYLTEEDQRAYIEKVGPELKSILGDYARSAPFGYDEKVQKRLNSDIRKMKVRIKKEILE